MDQPHFVTHVIFLIFFGTAILATIALYTRQSLLVAYIVLGALLGPSGIKLISNTNIIKEAGEVGIIFLLFLLGLDLQPQSLFHSLRKMSLIALSSSAVFFLLGFLLGYAFGYNYNESFVIGLAAMFSSTIIGIKLLPTTTLHHQHTGELVISILLLQDMLAIVAMLMLEVTASQGGSRHIGLTIMALPVLLVTAYVFQRFILSALIRRFDKIHEYIFILSIGWCLSMTEFSHALGLSEEIGAFIGGISLASNPVSSYIVENLKPVRDFFLVIFFFSIGAGFDFTYLESVILPACALAGVMLLCKPLIFSWLLRKSGEVKKISWEIGVRLGQLSEFSMLIIYMALQTGLVPSLTAYMVEAAIILTFIVSCYWTVMRYPTPLAVRDSLRRD